MRALAQLLLIALVLGVAIPRHACCALNAAFGSLESETACCCCNDPQSGESSPVRPEGEGPCCKHLDQIFTQTQHESCRFAQSTVEFWIPPLVFCRGADRSVAGNWLSRHPPCRLPKPVQVVFCQWNC